MVFQHFNQLYIHIASANKEDNEDNQRISQNVHPYEY